MLWKIYLRNLMFWGVSPSALLLKGLKDTVPLEYICYVLASDYFQQMFLVNTWLTGFISLKAVCLVLPGCTQLLTQKQRHLTDGQIRFNAGFVRGKKKKYVQKTLEPNVERVMWKRKECRVGYRLTSCSPEHPHYACWPLQHMGFLQKTSCPTTGVDPCLEVPALALTPQGITGLRAQGVPTTAWSSMQWILSPGVRHTSESHCVCRPHAEAMCSSRVWGSSGYH